MSGYPALGSSYSAQHAQLHAQAASAQDGSFVPQLSMPQANYPYDGQALHQAQPISYPPQTVNGQGEGSEPPARPGRAPLANKSGKGQKGNRLRRACDSCSTRKVKCDESGPPCQPCIALTIPCTFNKPQRRRGPLNRHAEAIKKRQLEEASADASSPASASNVAATLASMSTHGVLSTDAIGPWFLLEHLVVDFFACIHPLCPVPHEASFLCAFNAREDHSNPRFLALLASMIGTLVASFPERPFFHLKAQNREDLISSSTNLVEKCHKVAIEARGAGFLDTDLSVYDAVTSYFLGLMSAYTFNWNQCRLYFGETLTLTRVLGAHKLKPTAVTVGALPQYYGANDDYVVYQAPAPVDFIQQETERRLFWVMFVGIRSMQQLGASFSELVMPPSTATQPYPPLPLEVDDQYIFPQYIDPQPTGIISRITGFNLNVQIYLTLAPLATMELANGIDQVLHYTSQKAILSDCLRAVKAVVANNPSELKLEPGSQPGQFATLRLSKSYSIPDYTDGQSNGHDRHQWSQIQYAERRKQQYEAQRANLYASQLETRSYIIEKWCKLQEAYLQTKAVEEQIPGSGIPATPFEVELLKHLASDSDAVEPDIASEREDVVRDLLKMLIGINQTMIQSNGGTFMHRIRQIAFALVNKPESRKGPLAQKAEEHLARFMDILPKLDGVGSRVDPGANDAGNDLEHLKHWADLRECQNRVAQVGGVLSGLS